MAPNCARIQLRTWAKLLGLINGNASGICRGRRDGSFHSTTETGGLGLGEVFRITREGVFTSLASFDGLGLGAAPRSGVILASDGNLYGVTQSRVFKVTPGGEISVIAVLKR
ncbi:MAG: hypothetical protein QM755_19385 [Luteolibacter sp.]